MNTTSSRRRRSKSQKLARRIQVQAKDKKPQWWRVDFHRPVKFHGLWFKRNFAYVKARTPHEAVITLHHLGASGRVEGALPLGNAESRWKLNVPLSAAWAVWVEAR